mgnify:FL=1
MPIKRSEAFGEAFKQRKKNEEEVGFIESALAGVATGVINIPKTAFSLGAELIDLGLGTETAASVEKFFDDLNPFDDEAEARTIGRITTALTQVGTAGVFGAIKGAAAAPRIAAAANNLAKRALQAKQTGKYFGTLDFGRKVAAGGAKFVGKNAKVTGAVVGSGLGEAVVSDEDIGTLGDMLRGTSLEGAALTMMDRESKEGRAEAYRKLMNRVKFGTEGALFNLGLVGIGKGIQALRTPPEKGLIEYSNYGAFGNTSLGKIYQKYLRFGLSPQGTGTKATLELKQGALSSQDAVEFLAKKEIDRFDKALKDVFPAIEDTYFTGGKKVPSAQAEKLFLKDVQEIMQPTKGTQESILNQAKRDLAFEIDPDTGLRRLKNPIADDVDLFKVQDYTITKGGKLDELLKKVSQTGADPEPLKNAILNFRSSVDSMSARILSRGLPEELSKTIQKQIGGYLTTEYQMFNNLNPLYRYKPTDEIKNKAKRLLVNDKIKFETTKRIKELQNQGASFDEVANFKLSQKDVAKIKNEAQIEYDIFLKKKSLDDVLEELPDGTKVPVKDQIVGKPPTKEIAKQEIDAISINPSILKNKVLKPWQELLAGKITDPRYTFISTVGKQANLNYTLKYMDEVNKLGSTGPNKFIFSGADDLVESGLARNTEEALDLLKDTNKFKQVPIKYLEEAPTGLSALEGKYVRAPIYDAVFDTANNLLNNNLAGQIYKYSILGPKAITQVAKTVLSFVTHMRNFLSAGSFALANGAAFPNYGDIDVLFRGKGALPVKDLTFGRVFNTKEFDEVVENLYARGLRRGIFQSQTQIGEFKRVFRDFTTLTPGQVDAKVTRGLFNVKDRVTKLYGKIQDAYVAEDDFWKGITFNLERNRFNKVFDDYRINASNFRQVLEGNEQAVKALGPNGKKLSEFIQTSVQRDFDSVTKQFNGTFDDFLDEVSANLVRNQVPNYAYIGRAGRALRLSPFGNFIAFPLEIFRTGNNIITQGIKEINSGVPEIVKLGHKRLISFGATVGAVPNALRETGKALNNVTEDEMEALKRYVPEWSENSTLIPVGRDKKGYLRYLDFSYSNAYDTLTRPVQAVYNAIAQGANSEESMKEAAGKGMMTAAKEILKPFSEESIFTQALTESVFGRGVGKNGKIIYSPEDDTFIKIRKSFAHLGSTFKPGTFDQLVRFSRSVTGASDKYGRSFPIKDEVFGLLGYRPLGVDPERGLKFKTSALNKKLRQDRALFTSPLLRGGRITSEDIVENYKYSEARRFYNLKEAYKDINAARELGMSDASIERELKSRPGLKREIIRNLMDGVFTPQEPTDFFKRRVAEINEDLNRQEGVSIPNPYNKAETIIDRLINKNVRINLGDESKSLSDIDLPKQSLFDTKIQTPPVVTAPIDPTITNQTSAQVGSTLPPNFASLSTAEKLKALQDIGITIR